MMESVDVEEMQAPEYLGTHLYLPVLPFGFPITPFMPATSLSNSYRSSDANDDYDGIELPMGIWTLTQGNLWPIGKVTERSG